MSDDNLHTLGDRIVSSTEQATDRAMSTTERLGAAASAQAETSNNLLLEAQRAAQVAVVATAKATTNINRLTVALVGLTAFIVMFGVMFAIVFWRYAIVLRLPPP